jgi:hypothetical protein
VLDGASKFLHGTRFLSDLEQTKGYEFVSMVIVNCAQGNLPPSGAPEQEVFRSASEFYVAMTRAKNQLVLSFSGTVCDWLAILQLPISQWSDVVDTDDLPKVGVPGFLQEFPDTETLNLRDLTGTEFVLTPYARGLEVELQEQLEELVDGRGMMQARTQRRLKWKNVGALIDDLESGGGTSVLGPAARDAIKTRLVEASLGLRPSIRSKPIRKRPSSQIQIAPSAEAGENKPVTRETPASRGLEKLGLATREMIILHSLNIRLLQDLIAANEKILARYLAKAKISTLKERAKALERSAEPIGPSDVQLSEVDFSKQIVGILMKMGVTKLDDLGRLSKGDLWTQSQLGKTDVQRILKVCREHGLTLKDG